MTDNLDDWLIWSNEHDAWWGSLGVGYTRVIGLAGRYKYAQALKNANEHLSSYRPNEVMCPDLWPDDRGPGRFVPLKNIGKRG
jgi:hypothetical protein